MSSEEIKSVGDEIDWKVIEQIHQATLQISSSCFEYKKLCVAVLGAVTALLIKFGSYTQDNVVFALGILICAGFWLSDATAYYYQRRLRQLMDKKFKNIAERNRVEYIDKAISYSIWRSIFNGSMTLYYALMIIIIVLWIAARSTSIVII